MEISAFNANSAIELAKQNENSEITKLQNELHYLRQENQKLRSESFNRYANNNLNSFDPLAIFDFSQNPTKDELKKRFKELSKKLHPDTGGSNFLMQLLNRANEQLEKIV